MTQQPSSCHRVRGDPGLLSPRYRPPSIPLTRQGLPCRRLLLPAAARVMRCTFRQLRSLPKTLKAYQVRLGGLLQRQHSLALEAQVRLEVLGNFADQTLERQLANEQLSRLLVPATQSEGAGKRQKTIRALHPYSCFFFRCLPRPSFRGAEANLIPASFTLLLLTSEFHAAPPSQGDSDGASSHRQ